MTPACKFYSQKQYNWKLEETQSVGWSPALKWKSTQNFVFEMYVGVWKNKFYSGTT